MSCRPFISLARMWIMWTGLLFFGSLLHAEISMEAQKSGVLKAIETLEAAPIETTLPDLRQLMIKSLMDSGFEPYEARGLIPSPRLAESETALTPRQRADRWRSLCKAKLRQYLEAITAQATTETGWQNKRDEVLEDPIFAVDIKEPTLLERINRKIFEWFQILFSKTASVAGRFGKPLIILIILGCVSLIGLILYRSTQNRSKPPQLKDAVTVEVKPQIASDHWQTQADQALKEGNIVFALKAWLRFVRLECMQRGLLPPRKGLTDLECAEALKLAKNPSLFHSFRDLVQLYERIIYAGGSATTEVGLQAQSLVQQIKESLTGSDSS